MLDLFQPDVARWFVETLGRPTTVQEKSFPFIAAGKSTLVAAPTGSGKTLAAFLAAIDFLAHEREPAKPVSHGRRAAPPRDVSVVYISPLKALATDVDKNLREPIRGILATAAVMGVEVREPRVVVRTGDTPSGERARFQRHGGDILITTPESLYLLLTSEARKTLRRVRTVIIDEIHAVAGTKRGSHLFSTLERLEANRDVETPLQRVGLSATQRPLELVARALGGFSAPGVPRPVEIVDAGSRRALELSIEVPLEDMSLGRDMSDVGPTARGATGRAKNRGRTSEASTESGDGAPHEERPLTSIWPSIHTRLVELVRAHRSTMIFVNSRRLGERLATALNDVAGAEIALAHHGSVAQDKRREIEARLKSGDLPAIVATSSLELGIDMGAVDLVVQIEAPPSVSSGIQRVGRAGHRVGEISKGIVFPKFLGDLLACAATVESMEEGLVERTSVPSSPLDVLAQQIVAAVATEPIAADELHEILRRSLPFAEISRDVFHGVLDMLSGLYPSDEFAGLRPRISWDRETGLLSPRAGTRTVAISSGGTIADRGLYGVHLAGGDGKSTRIGELDEEMVFETRIGDVFLLGASAWRVEEITPDRVLVSPAPGEIGRMPFWRGDRAGRPAELGERIGALARRVVDLPDAEAIALLAKSKLDARGAKNLLRYLHEQREATGEVPSDRTIVLERFRDEVGDVRICILSPYGGRVHAAWAMAIASSARDRSSLDMDVFWTDDGIVFRVADVEAAPADDLFVPSSLEVDDLVRRGLDATALFAGRFRENAARALLLPRGRPGKRSPLWAQRKKASELLAVASRYPSFPIVLETYRECLRDVLDLPALGALLRRIESGEVRVASVESERPSPFARTLLFSYVGNFVYEGDTPLAERRAQALQVDEARLAELTGGTELRGLLDADAIADVEASLQRLGDRRVHHADGMHDMLLSIGDLSSDEIARRTDAPRAEDIVAELASARRIVRAVIGGEARWFAAEDAGRMRDALGVELPPGLPSAFLAPVSNALGDVVSRYARTHGPFDLAALASRFGIAHAEAERAVDALARTGRVVRGHFRPGGTTEELVDADVLRRIKKRSLAKLRREIEPVPKDVLAELAIVHHRVGARARGESAIAAAIDALEGAVLPASALLGDILPARVRAFSSFELDHLTAQGDVLWRGIEPLGASDARVALYNAEHYSLLAPPAGAPDGDLERAIVAALGNRGAIFFRELVAIVGGFAPSVLDAIWSLVFKGLVTNDTLAPLRSRLAPRDRHRPRPGRLHAPSRAMGSEGRWSLLPTDRAPPTDRAAAIASSLLRRHAVLTREAVLAESPPGGYAAIYPVLRAMEEAGRLRRGYFVEGVAAMQFALPGAEGRLRALRAARDRPTTASHRPAESDAAIVASTDPANLYGAAIAWPRVEDGTDPRLERSAGTHVVLRRGRLVAFVGKGHRSIATIASLSEDDRSSIARGLRARADDDWGPALLVERVDGDRARGSILGAALEQAGFRPSGEGGLLYVSREPALRSRHERGLDDGDLADDDAPGG